MLQLVAELKDFLIRKDGSLTLIIPTKASNLYSDYHQFTIVIPVEILRCLDISHGVKLDED